MLPARGDNGSGRFRLCEKTRSAIVRSNGGRIRKEFRLGSRSLHLQIHVLGGLVLLANLAIAASSFIQAPGLWQKSTAAKAAGFFESLATTFPVFSWHRDLFASNWQIILSHYIPLGIVTLVCMLLLIVLPRASSRIDNSSVDALYLWAFASVPVLALAYPIFTQDLWLSAVWGRMALAGINPYSVAFTAEAVGTLPLDHFPMPMSYGPLWALVSAAVMVFAGASTLASFLLFKIVIAISWLASLVVLRKLGTDDSPVDRALAVVIFGWLPVGVGQAVAEGHNDITMTFLAMLWLYLLLRRNTTAPLALSASALCKYTTGPLFLADLIYARRHEGLAWTAYVRRMILPAILALVVFGIFVRSLQFLDGTRLLNVWRFLQPRDAVLAVDSILGGYVWPLAYVASAIFPIIAAWQCARLWVEPNRAQLIRACLAIMCAVTFSAVAHLWSWYIVWILPFAALVPGWWLSRFVIGVALLTPFTVAIWWISELQDYKEHAALVLYLGAIAWTVLARYEGVVVSARDNRPRTASPIARHIVSSGPSALRKDQPRATHSQKHSDAGQEA